MKRTRALTWLTIPLLLFFAGCGDNKPPAAPQATATATSIPSATRTATQPPTSTPTTARSTATESPTQTFRPSPTRSLPPTATQSATATASFTHTPSETVSPTVTSTAGRSPTATPTISQFAFQAPNTTDAAGPRTDGSGVLPNGRIVRPLGRQATVNTLPLNLRLGPQGHIFVTNDGNGTDDGKRYLHVVDPQTLAVSRVESTHDYGLAISPDGSRVYVSNAPNDRIDAFAFDGQSLTPITSPAMQFPQRTYPMGIDLSPDGQTLYVAGAQSNTFWAVDVATGTMTQANLKIGNWPFAVLVTKDGSRAYVSSWGINNNNPTNLLPVPLPPTDPNTGTRSSVAVIDLTRTRPTLSKYVPIARSHAIDNRSVFGGSHPSAMALSPDGGLLYVTATNLDLLSVIDTATLEVVTDVDLNVLGDGLQGLYPDAVAVAADGKRLYVADAGINAVQVVDVDPIRRTFLPRGFLPTGWYPSAVALSADGQTLYVANAKGLGSGSNGGELVDISFTVLSDTPYYIGHIIKGTLSAIDVSHIDDQLADDTAAVLANNGFNPLPPAVDTSVVPADFGHGPSPLVKHVVYILKENRTYDQILGDLEVGAGDPRLTLFGEDVTPNHHQLARQFAFGDNFFHDAEVSYPGHEWVTQGNNNDWVEKIWPVEYNNFLNTPFNIETGQEGFTKGGYIFEALARQGISLRVYGEPLAFNSKLAAGPTGGGAAETLKMLLKAFGSVNALASSVGDLLAGRIDALRAKGVDVDILINDVWPELKLDYPSNILADRTDVERSELFKAELAQFEENGAMPQFLFIWIPNDHTFGAAPRMPSPRSAVADNDQGLGRIVEALSQSRFWSDMAIFVSEDDAQDGQDHVEAHRTLSYIISPYGKRGYVSHIHHSNMSMLKTMELLLGAQPMSQYDRYATDMRDYFTPTANPAPYAALASRVGAELNREAEDQPNALLREAAEVSEDLNLDGYDEAGPELSRVLWLVHVGAQVEHQRRVAMWSAAAMPVLLVAMGMVLQRRRRAALAR
ncbi:MAG: beta-propeller fold lactonase family protein [Deltaproteobacteria bacterium]|nr:beta-propeller fold lactonase family protein [Deltaproteobacteria bacterium]